MTSSLWKSCLPKLLSLKWVGGKRWRKCFNKSIFFPSFITSRNGLKWNNKSMRGAELCKLLWFRSEGHWGEIVDHECFLCVSTSSYRAQLHALSHTHWHAQSIGPIFSLPRCHYGNPLLLSSQHAPPAHHTRYCPLLSNPLGCRETIPKHDWKEWIVGVASGKEKLLKGARWVCRSCSDSSLYLDRGVCGISVAEYAESSSVSRNGSAAEAPLLCFSTCTHLQRNNCD